MYECCSSGRRSPRLHCSLRVNLFEVQSSFSRFAREPACLAVAMQASKSGSSVPEEEVPKWPIYAFIGVVFIGAPLMPTSKGGGVFAKIVGTVYNRVGVAGLLAIPFGSLAIEKSTYDTYCAYWGNDIYAKQKATGSVDGQHGGFPSGGAALPSLSLIKTRVLTDRTIFRNELLDKAWCAVRGYES